jgi:hypothetical protein
MTPIVLPVDPLRVFDLAAKSLARTSGDGRHSYFDHLTGKIHARVPDGWRFPFVESYFDSQDPQAILNLNRVTFIYAEEPDASTPSVIELISDAAAPFQNMRLQKVQDSKYWALTLLVPTRKVFRYLFRVDGTLQLDPVNPKSTQDEKLNSWSFFWTDYCQKPVTFEIWEIVLLQRLVRHILPFNSQESEIFLSTLNSSTLTPSGGHLYRLDLEMGAVNFIDKLVAGPELHHQQSYKTCLLLINDILRKSNPYQEPRSMDKKMFIELYDQMAAGTVPGWDTSRYSSPSYFLKLLRRHTFTGAFSHPRHGGNSGAYAWDYLKERFPPFEWNRAVEIPWGTNASYRG